MPTKEEKRRRRELTRELADRERADIESRMPFSRALLEELVGTLDAELFSDDRSPPCDHTLKLTEAFLGGRNAWSQEAREWLGERGGYCDCEVVYNVSDWLDGGL